MNKYIITSNTPVSAKQLKFRRFFYKFNKKTDTMEFDRIVRNKDGVRSFFYTMKTAPRYHERDLPDILACIEDMKNTSSQAYRRELYVVRINE